jgi:acetyltransferase-like isoleucine patch superfamily enzyme
MKQKIKNFFSYFNKIWLLANLKNKDISTSEFFKTKIKNPDNNSIRILSSKIENTDLTVNGRDNEIEFTGAYVAGSTITLEGGNNKICFEKGVMFRDSSLIIRGENCTVHIGANSTFGGIRIVNVGKHNAVSIGSDCLFSDNIELWASDTHAIMNEKKEHINPEKPVRIGNNVWVGSRVIILKGVSIDDGSIIGMGSVVTKSVPANVISAGYPNRTIKENVSWKLEY